MNNQNMRSARAPWKKLFLGLALTVATLVSHAQTAIESVTGSVQGGLEAIRIDLSQALTAVPRASRSSPRRASRLTFPASPMAWAVPPSTSTRAT
jgi:type IV pilus assembly protein PilQ